MCIQRPAGPAQGGGMHPISPHTTPPVPGPASRQRTTSSGTDQGSGGGSGRYYGTAGRYDGSVEPTGRFTDCGFGDAMAGAARLGGRQV
jgi:hypothetical protein